MWVEREMGERNKKRGIKKKEQKYEVKISSTPYAVNGGKVENNVHEIFLQVLTLQIQIKDGVKRARVQ